MGFATEAEDSFPVRGHESKSPAWLLIPALQANVKKQCMITQRTCPRPRKMSIPIILMPSSFVLTTGIASHIHPYDAVGQKTMEANRELHACLPLALNQLRVGTIMVKFPLHSGGGSKSGKVE